MMLPPPPPFSFPFSSSCFFSFLLAWSRFLEGKRREMIYPLVPARVWAKFTKVFLTFSRLFFTNSECVCAIFEAIYRHFDVQKMANFLPFPSPFSVVAFFYWCVIVKEKGGGKKREMSAEGKSP